MNFKKNSYQCLLFTLLLALGACNNQHEYEINSTEKYEKNKSSLAETEQKNPIRFLSVKGEKKKNLLGQMVVRGKIFNNGKIVTYKDVAIQISFYSKTGTLLEEDTDVVYENIQPGESKSFKSKIFAPKGSDSLSLKIIGAKF